MWALRRSPSNSPKLWPRSILLPPLPLALLTMLPPLLAPLPQLASPHSDDVITRMGNLGRFTLQTDSAAAAVTASTQCMVGAFDVEETGGPSSGEVGTLSTGGTVNSSLWLHCPLKQVSFVSTQGCPMPCKDWESFKRIN